MWKFLMAYLSNIEFHNQGDMSGLLTIPVDRTKPLLVAFVWMDRNRLYFIFTGGVDGERAAVHSHTIESRGPCPKCRAQYG